MLKSWGRVCEPSNLSFDVLRRIHLFAFLEIMTTI